MYDDVQTAEIMRTGMNLLRENLGVIESEIFITTIAINQLDYTKWRENLWEDLTPAELFERAKTTEQKYGVPQNVITL